MEGILRGQDQRPVGRRHEHRRIRGSTRTWPATSLERLEFLVVQDMYHTTETAQLADLVLPAAGWGEKDGTFINSERRIGVIKKGRRAPGQALSDFNIFRLIAEAWGCGEMFRRLGLAGGRVSDSEGTARAASRATSPASTDYRMLEECGGIQWPFVKGQETGAEGQGTIQSQQRSSPDSQLSTLNARLFQERRLFADGRFFTPSRRAKFLFDAPRPLPEAPSPRYPFLLLTGRGSASQWHTQTRTRQSAVLRKLYPERQYVEIESGGRPRTRSPAGCGGPGGITARLAARECVSDSLRPARTGLHTDARRDNEPVDRRGL